MTEAPRSLKLPVGENHSSLKRAGAPRHLRETSGVQPFSHRDRIGYVNRQGGCIAPQGSLPVSIMSRPSPGKAVIMSGAPVSERQRGSEIGYVWPLAGST